ncbi:hypothetical protein [Legionella impletisoli]|uniref:Uncharacterized protein n=1 Tax=Legionella impletisoli TaxID=343510 RepID=A0A917JKZ8_9GAMM|nr:hypothetical protein [Legionella impletisoli]GGI75350.1 hypothetical protein GCM10007966_00160 [Legionella impletisoli]
MAHSPNSVTEIAKLSCLAGKVFTEQDEKEKKGLYEQYIQTFQILYRRVTSSSTSTDEDIDAKASELANKIYNDALTSKKTKEDFEAEITWSMTKALTPQPAASGKSGESPNLPEHSDSGSITPSFYLKAMSSPGMRVASILMLLAGIVLISLAISLAFCTGLSGFCLLVALCVGESIKVTPGLLAIGAIGATGSLAAGAGLFAGGHYLRRKGEEAANVIKEVPTSSSSTEVGIVEPSLSQ